MHKIMRENEGLQIHEYADSVDELLRVELTVEFNVVCFVADLLDGLPAEAHSEAESKECRRAAYCKSDALNFVPAQSVRSSWLLPSILSENHGEYLEVLATTCLVAKVLATTALVAMVALSLSTILESTSALS